MARIVALIGKTATGFIDPVSGLKLGCVADENAIDKLLTHYARLGAGKGVVKIKGDEVKMDELICLATNTGGGELKRRVRFAPIA